jgi:branched-chain amino acid transport system substrate-binding protein
MRIREIFLALSYYGLVILVFPFSLHADNSVLNIGVIAPLSGGLAEYGTAFKNGVSLAQSEKRNSSCKFVFEDSKYDPNTAVSAFRKIVHHDDVRILYNFGGPTTAALAPLAESSRVVLFTSETEPHFSKGRKYVLRFNSPSEAFGRALSDGLKRSGYRRIGLVRTENEYINGVFHALKETLSDNIRMTELAVVLPSQNDFSTIISKARVTDYDAIGVFLLPGQISLFYRQLQKQKLSPQTFALDFLESAPEIEASGPSVSGVIFPANAVDDSFRIKYRQANGNGAQIQYAGFGHDFAELILERVCSEAKSPSTSDELLALLKNSSGQGVNGEFKYVETEEDDKYFAFPVVLRKVEKVDLVTIWPKSSS